jgi:hypothetical protein
MYVHEYVYIGEGEVLYLLSKGETWDEIEECVTLVCVCVLADIFLRMLPDIRADSAFIYIYTYVYINMCVCMCGCEGLERE